MKKLLFTGFFSFFLFHFSLGQNAIYQLHSLVGDTIDIQEKKAYHLFSEISDTTFNYSYIRQVGLDFKLITHFTNDSINTKTVEKKELQKYSLRIQKFEDFYERKKSINRNKANYSLLDSQNVYQINTGIGNFITQKDKAITLSPKIQDYKERRKLFYQGFAVPNFELELQFKKKKKSKK